MSRGNINPRIRAILTVIGLAAVWLLLMAASVWPVLNWSIIGSILEDRIEPILPFVRSFGGIRTTVYGVDVRELIYFLVVLATLATIAARSSRLPGKRFWLACIPLAAILVAARLSLAWSVAPSLTDSQLAPYFIIALAALIWGALLTEREIWSALEALAIAAVLLNLVALVYFPSWARMADADDGGWRGLLAHKNQLGPLLVFANTVAVIRLSSPQPQNRMLRLGRSMLFAFSLWMLWHTRSVGSLLVMVGIYTLYAAVLLYLKWGERLRWRFWAGLAGLALAAAAGLWLGLAPLLALLDRSASLTGRIPLWSQLSMFVEAKPVLGYGFGRAFWGNYNDLIAAYIRWRPAQAHNGFIESALDLGLIGAFLMVVFLAQSTVLTLRYFSQRRTLASIWPTLLIVLVLGLNLVESLLGSTSSFIWFLLVLTFSFALYQEVESRERALEKLPENSPAIPGDPVSPAEAGAVDTSNRSSTSDVTPEGSVATGQSWRARSYCRTAGFLLLIIGVLGWYWQGTPGILSLQQPLELGLHLVSGAIALWAGSTSTGSRFAILLARMLGLAYSLLALIGFVHPAVPYGSYLHPGDSLIHLILGVWGLWAGFFAKAEDRARSL
jgi:O-antigen ligase